MNDTDKWKNTIGFWIERTVKMSTLKVNRISEFQWHINGILEFLKFIFKRKRSRRVKAILKKKDKAEGSKYRGL